jgi:type III pantothenate kinase
MILLVDIGNTRIKVALLEGARVSAMLAARHEGKPTVVRRMIASAPPGIERVVAVNVAGPALERALTAAVKQRFGVRCEIVHSARSACGVRNGYTDAWRLGDDRWVGAIGAHELARGRTVVFANAGTALTVDTVSADGRHRGGVIVPGPGAMVDALLVGTAGIRRRARGVAASAKTPFASNTASALAAGAAFAGAALIDRVVAEAGREFGGRPLLLLAGGSAELLTPHLKSAHRLVPDLILRGLAVVAGKWGHSSFASKRGQTSRRG